MKPEEIELKTLMYQLIDRVHATDYSYNALIIKAIAKCCTDVSKGGLTDITAYMKMLKLSTEGKDLAPSQPRSNLFKSIEAPQAIKRWEDVATCAICLNPRIHSRALECNHAFCFSCINQWATVKRSRSISYVDCPECKRQFPFPFVTYVTEPKTEGFTKIDALVRMIRERQGPFLVYFLGHVVQFESKLTHMTGLRCGHLTTRTGNCATLLDWDAGNLDVLIVGTFHPTISFHKARHVIVMSEPATPRVASMLANISYETKCTQLVYDGMFDHFQSMGYSIDFKKPTHRRLAHFLIHRKDIFPKVYEVISTLKEQNTGAKTKLCYRGQWLCLRINDTKYEFGLTTNLTGRAKQDNAVVSFDELYNRVCQQAKDAKHWSLLEKHLLVCTQTLQHHTIQHSSFTMNLRAAIFINAYTPQEHKDSKTSKELLQYFKNSFPSTLHGQPVPEAKDQPAPEAKDQPAPEAKEQPVPEAKEQPVPEAKEQPMEESVEAKDQDYKEPMTQEDAVRCRPYEGKNSSSRAAQNNSRYVSICLCNIQALTCFVFFRRPADSLVSAIRINSSQGESINSGYVLVYFFSTITVCFTHIFFR